MAGETPTHPRDTSLLFTSVAGPVCRWKQPRSNAPAATRSHPQQRLAHHELNWLGLYGDCRYVSKGTVPVGSTWAQNPIPRNDVQNTGQGFPPHCNTTGALGCQGMWDGGARDGVGPNVAVPSLEIVDWVQIPSGVPPGKYVLGWRWDCEVSPVGCRCANSWLVSLCTQTLSVGCRNRIRSGNRAPTLSSPRSTSITGHVKHWCQHLQLASA